MYDELIKRLRERCVFLFPHHGESRSYDADLMHEAADAIEELNSQLDDFKRLCLPLKENRLYKYSGGSLVEVFLMLIPEPPKEDI